MRYHVLAFWIVLLVFTALVGFSACFYLKTITSNEIADYKWYVDAFKFFGYEAKSVSNLKSIFEVFLIFIGLLTAICPFLIYLLTRQTAKDLMDRFSPKVPISQHGIPNIGDDLTLMLKYYSRAESVHVFSGDFDWIAGNSEISMVVEKLIKSGRIFFYTHCDREAIKKSIGDVLFFQAVRYFKFDMKVELKCSIVKMQSGRSYLLYKSKAIEQSDDRIYIFEDSDDLRFALSKVDEIVGHVSTEPVAIIVTGKTGSGKTVLSKALEAKGFFHVSAGDVFRDLAKVCDLDPRKREDLIKIGRSYMNVFGGGSLSSELIRRSGSNSRVVIDGVRPLETLIQLRQHYSRSAIIYIECDDVKRVQNAKARGDRKAIAIDNEIDELLVNTLYVCDIIINNSEYASSEEFTKAAIEILSNKLEI